MVAPATAAFASLPADKNYEAALGSLANKAGEFVVQVSDWASAVSTGSVDVEAITQVFKNGEFMQTLWAEGSSQDRLADYQNALRTKG